MSFIIYLGGFLIEPATLQALSADCLSLITWRDISTEALEACFALELISFSTLRHFMLEKDHAERLALFPRDPRHFMREKPIVSSVI